MKPSRIVQFIAIFLLFIIAVVLFSNSGSAPVESNSEYIPPSP